MAQLGQWSLLTMLILTCLSIVVALSIRRVELLNRLAINHFLLISIAMVVLFHAFLTNNFSITYIAKHSNVYLPFYYKLSASWSGHEGSLLLWLFLLTTVIMLSTRIHSANVTHKKNAGIFRIVAIISNIILAATLSFALFTSNPFTTTDPKDFIPINGKDLNPLLQDPALIFHPPFLFVGYVCFAPVFIWVCAMLSKNTYADWIFNRIQWWARVGWVFLTLGIALGSFWAYYELGWGGFWFWDPVENASLLPWFFATALLHALNHHHTMRRWVIFFAISTFLLSLLATFLVRSGVLISVHSFAADNLRGMYLLFMLMLFAIPSFSLFVWRLDALSADHVSPDKIIFFLNINNLLLLVAGFTVLLGTLAPMAFIIFFSQAISVGAPYFNFMISMLWGLALVFLIAMSWDKGSWLLTIVGLIMALGLYMLNVWQSPTQWSAWGLITLLCIAISVNLIKRQPVHILLAHTGFFIMSLGIIVTSYFSVTKVVSLKPNDSITIAEYNIKMINHTQSKNAVYEAFHTHFLVSNKFKNQVHILSPEKRRYLIGGQVLSETAILPTLKHDLLLSIGSAGSTDDSWRVRTQYRPMVRWIWAGALCMVAGVLLTLLNSWKKREV